MTLPDDVEIDSEEEIDGIIFYSKFSHSDPIRLRGVFDSYEKAKSYAAECKVFKYIVYGCFTDDESGGCFSTVYYDSFESDEEPSYCFTEDMAEESSCSEYEVEYYESRTGFPYSIVKKVRAEDKIEGVPVGAYIYAVLSQASHF